MPEECIQLFVKFDASTLPVSVAKSGTVGDIRFEISSVKGVASSDVRIIFAGRELHDHQKLSDIDIQSQTVVHAFQGKRFQTRRPVLQRRESMKSRTSIPTYYVLCRKVCGGVKPGKLRARCSRCHDDSIVLTSEPRGWEDVLERGKLQGTCHTEHCGGTTPELYFKCREHQSQSHDHVVPLPLVKNNLLKVPCMTCLEDDTNPILVFPCPFKHVICITCFTSYCQHQLNTRQFMEHDTVGYTLPCPGFAEECRTAVITDNHHFGVMGPSDYERYKQFGAEECLLKMGGVLCPGPGCGMGIFVEGNEGSSAVESNYVECTECGLNFCVLCKDPYHGQEPCTENLIGNTDGSRILSHYAVNVAMSRYDSDTVDVIRKTTKPCPQCGTPVEKNGGCMHMECPLARCQFSWCWICGTEWEQDCQDNHWFG